MHAHSSADKPKHFLRKRNTCSKTQRILLFTLELFYIDQGKHITQYPQKKGYEDRVTLTGAFLGVGLPINTFS